MKAEPIRSQLLFSSSIFTNEVVFSWGSLPFLAAVVIPSEFGPYCISMTSNKCAISWDDNATVYSEDQHWQGRPFHRPNCWRAWMKIHRLAVRLGEVVKVRLRRVDLRARQPGFAVTELLSQLCKEPWKSGTGQVVHQKCHAALTEAVHYILDLKTLTVLFSCPAASQGPAMEEKCIYSQRNNIIVSWQWRFQSCDWLLHCTVTIRATTLYSVFTVSKHKAGVLLYFSYCKKKKTWRYQNQPKEF